jgi:magnesium transporter
LALPVVDEDHRLLGIVTVDDIMDVIEDEATEDIYRLGGLSWQERIESPAREKVSKRLPWMIINLGTAFLAAWVVGLFEESIAKVVALAIFMPVVAGMGGNGGTQALTVVTRGIALGEVEFTAGIKVVLKEIGVGILIGAATGILTALIAYLWRGNPFLGFVLFLAMVLNMAIAGLTGAGIPLLLKFFGQDPALGSGVLVTTFTDVFGFLTFLGLATVFIKYLV